MAAFLDVCRFTPTGGGLGDWTYSVAATGYQSPAKAGAVNGTIYKYRAESADLTQWELGEGTYDSALTKFARTTVLYNSAGTGLGVGQSGAGSKINFTTTPQVAIVALKEDLISVEENNAFSGAQQLQARTNIGLSAVDNTSDVNKPVSTAQAASIATRQAALGFAPVQQGTGILQAPGNVICIGYAPSTGKPRLTIDVTDFGNIVFENSPLFTGVPAAPTAAPGTNTIQLATTAFVLANASGVSNATRVFDYLNFS